MKELKKRLEDWTIWANINWKESLPHLQKLFDENNYK